MKELCFFIAAFGALGCTNTVHTQAAPNALADSAHVVSGATLVWSDLRTAMLSCADPILRSAWDQLFPTSQASDPDASGSAQISLGQVTAVASGRGVSVAALGYGLSISGFASLSLSDTSNASDPIGPATISVTRAGQVRNIDLAAKDLPRLVALFSPEDVAKRQSINMPGETDVITDLHFSDTADGQVELQISPPIDGVASSFTLNLGAYSTCLKQALKITQSLQ